MKRIKGICLLMLLLLTCQIQSVAATKAEVLRMLNGICADLTKELPEDLGDGVVWTKINMVRAGEHTGHPELVFTYSLDLKTMLGSDSPQSIDKNQLMKLLRPELKKAIGETLKSDLEKSTISDFLRHAIGITVQFYTTSGEYLGENFYTSSEMLK